MGECRRKSSHSSSESLSHQKDHALINHGFVSKLVNDIRKLYDYEPDKIKWMNEKPEHRKAYEPTEVRNYRLISN